MFLRWILICLILIFWWIVHLKLSYENILLLISVPLSLQIQAGNLLYVSMIYVVWTFFELNAILFHCFLVRRALLELVQKGSIQLWKQLPLSLIYHLLTPGPCWDLHPLIESLHQIRSLLWLCRDWCRLQ